MATRVAAADGAGTAIAFPGQGGDWKAAREALDAAPDHPLVQALAERLGTDDWDALDGLDTRNAQPAIYVAGLVGPGAATVADLAVGHSLGEITASAWAGALDPGDGLDLVVARAALGHAAHAERPGGMAAFMRWDHARVDWLRRTVLAEGGGLLDVAVVNSPTQVVLSGDEALVDRAVALANEQGGVARRLPIGGAYHSPLLVRSLDAFAGQVRDRLRHEPQVPVLSSTSGRAFTDPADLAEAVVRSLVLPVDWPATTRAALDLGARRLVDAGPGDTLARLGRFLPDLPVEVP